MGEPSGIGPIVALNSFKKICDKINLVLVSDFYKFQNLAKKLNVKTRKINKMAEARFAKQELDILHLNYEAPFTPGNYDLKNAQPVISSIKLAATICLNKEADAMVTGPINKYILKKSGGFRFDGHTDYLEHLCKSKAGAALMMMLNSELKIIPLTIHVPLNRVSSILTRKKLKELLLEATHELKTTFNIKQPKIAVLGLNPHAGENGAIGKEERLTIEPMISELNNQYGAYIDGPFSADGFFGSQAFKNYDLTVAMYHDQALIPLKLLSFFDSVNITLGLPLIRTSPGHGSAIELAKKGNANSKSYLKAIILADNLVNSKSVFTNQKNNE